MNNTLGPKDSGGKVVQGVLSGQGPVYSLNGNLVSVAARRGETGGTYGVIEAVVPPGVGTPMHIHTREEEGFLVIEGELEFEVDGRGLTATRGSFLHLPKGRPHGYVNRATQPAKVICLFVPGGFEGFFEEGGEPVDDLDLAVRSPSPADPRKLQTIGKKYGMEVVSGQMGHVL
jgi:quercetin dioxygenase-like cupin family protein